MPHIPTLAELMLEAKPRLSQAKLAAAAGVDRDTVYRASSGYNVGEGKCRDIVDGLNSSEPFKSSRPLGYDIIESGGKVSAPRSTSPASDNA